MEGVNGGTSELRWVLHGDKDPAQGIHTPYAAEVSKGAYLTKLERNGEWVG